MGSIDWPTLFVAWLCLNLECIGLLEIIKFKEAHFQVSLYHIVGGFTNSEDTRVDEAPACSQEAQ